MEIYIYVYLYLYETTFLHGLFSYFRVEKLLGLWVFVLAGQQCLSGVERLGYCPRFIAFDIIALYARMEFAHSITFGGASIPAMTCKVSDNHILRDSFSNCDLDRWEHTKTLYCAHPKSGASGSLCFVGSCRRMRGCASTRAWISIAAAPINLNVG